VVVCDMPFGKANLLNLVAATEAQCLVFIDDTPFEKRDFTDGRASAVYSQLSTRARHTMLQNLTSCVEEIQTEVKVAWSKR